MSDNICGKHALSVVIKIVATAALALLLVGGAGALENKRMLAAQASQNLAKILKV